tara:strand:- start:2343 stop:2891 length:549 start_codon:yes stop_codon:yes gene_type:complete
MILLDTCIPQLNPFDVHRLELENGYLHSTGGVATETRVVEIDYFDNRRIVTNLFDSQGTATLTNITNNNHQARKVKYRHHVKIPYGDYVVTQHDDDYEVCAIDGEVIFYVEVPLANGATHEVDWVYTIEIEPYGDLDGDGRIRGYDLGLFFAGWGLPGETDFNNDGITDGEDMGILFENWTG